MGRPVPEEECLPERGESPSFAELVDEFSRIVWAIGMSILGDRDRADEAFQETWANVGTALERGVQVRNPRAWVSQVARHTARKLLGSPASFPLPGEVPAPEAPDPVLAEEREAEVRRSLERIKPRDKEILLRWRLRGESLSRLAEAYGMSRGAVFNRIRRTLDRLRAILEPRLEPGG